ncbi:hypothetical protein [Streptomyces sp. NPDC056721]|uniref:hypothetical protein n=1 Tax=unclassified Streptomyces TaxID=2593676 RepID=UPI003690E763
MQEDIPDDREIGDRESVGGVPVLINRLGQQLFGAHGIPRAYGVHQPVNAILRRLVTYRIRHVAEKTSLRAQHRDLQGRMVDALRPR